jgi:hypothetical protein
MNYTYICPTCLARQGAPAGGKLVSQEIGGCMACRRLEVVFVYRVREGEREAEVPAIVNRRGVRQEWQTMPFTRRPVCHSIH